MKVSALQDQLGRLRETFGDAEVKASTGAGTPALDITGISFTLTAEGAEPSELVLQLGSPAPSSAPDASQVAPGPSTPGGTP